jgi:hypothetical protein
MIGREESTWMLSLPNQPFRNCGNALIQVRGSLDRLRGLHNWRLSSTDKWVSRIEKERPAKVPSDALVTRYESASGSALTGSTHWFEMPIESSDMKGYAHRTSVRVHKLNIHPHRRRSPTNTRLQRCHCASRRALACPSCIARL